MNDLISFPDARENDLLILFEAKSMKLRLRLFYGAFNQINLLSENLFLTHD